MVTHSKRMMAAADLIYGVTMQEPGVSKLVSVRLGGDEPHRDRPGSPAGRPFSDGLTLLPDRLSTLQGLRFFISSAHGQTIRSVTGSW